MGRGHSAQQQIARRFLAEIQEVARATDQSELLGALVHRAGEILGVQRVTIWLWDREQRVYLLAAARPEHPGFAVGATISPKSFPAVRVGYREAGPVLVPDALASDLVPRPFADLLNVRSILAVPLVNAGRPLGFITFDDPGHLHHFSGTQLQLASGIAAVAAAKLGQFAAGEILNVALARERLLRDLTRDVQNAPFALRDRLQRLTERAVEVLKADHGALYVVAPDGEHIADVLTVRIPEANVRRMRALVRAPIVDQPLGNALMAGRTIAVDDTEATPLGEEARSYGVRSFVAVPLHGRPVRMGALFLFYTTHSHTFTRDEIELAEDIGHVGGLAIKATYLYEAALEREQLRTQLLRRVNEAQEMQRRLLATELHDTVMQRQLLGGSLIELAEIALADGDPRTAARRLHEAKAELTQAQEATRHVTQSLQPPAIELDGLMSSLQELARPLMEAGLQVDLDGRIPEALDPDIAITAYAVLREALSNVRRHAEAEAVRISARVQEGRLVCRVVDDGCGFQTQAVSDLVRNGHFGIASMHERLSLAEGDLSITSRSGRGTVVRLEIPLARHATGNGSRISKR